MPRRLKIPPQHKPLLEGLDEIFRAYDEWRGKIERHETRHSCGHTHRYPFVLTDDLREALSQVECPSCQKTHRPRFGVSVGTRSGDD